MDNAVADISFATIKNRSRPAVTQTNGFPAANTLVSFTRGPGERPWLFRSTRRTDMIDLDGCTMYVSSTAATGVVGAQTRLHLKQRGDRVWARYSGGDVTHGWLVGRMVGDELHFRYAQTEHGAVHAGASVCDIEQLPNGRRRVIEHFTWTTRPGSGTNVFDEAAG